MSQELLNHKTKCRLCFQRVSVIRNCSRISEKIQQKFLSLTNIELKLSDSFSNSICKSCIKSLNEWSEFQQKMIDNQQRLYAFEGADKFFVKIEPIESSTIELQEIEIEDFLPKTEVFNDSWMGNHSPKLQENDFSPPSPATDDWIAAPEFDDYQDHQTSNDEVVESENQPKKRGRMRQYSKEQLYNAVEAVALGELTYDAASKSFGVPKTTILRNFTKDYYLLTDGEELQVKLYVNRRTESGIATTDDDIGKFILFRLLKKRRGKDRVKIKRISSIWVSLFRKRHSDMNVLEKFTECEFSCDICGFSINDKKKFRKHISLHSGASDYPKPSTKRRKIEEFEQAMQTVAGGLSFKKSAKLHGIPCTTLYNYHKKVTRQRNGVEPEIFNCSFCGKAFFSESSVRNHEIVHHLTPAGDFPCKDCGKVYSTKATLRAHVRVAHLIGIFNCSKCSKVFTRKQDLNVHGSIHQEDKTCEICGKLVKYGRSITQHLKSHTEQAIKCSFEGCSKEFQSTYTLRYHIESSHTEKQNLKCPKCSSTFPNSRRLKIHDERAHSAARYYCVVEGCNHINKRKEYLKRHLKNHRDIDVKYRDELIAKLDNKV